MSEHANVNMFDLKCPRKALSAVEMREDAGVTSDDLKDISSLFAGRSLVQFGALVAKGAEGVRQVGRAANCPQRNLSAETWTVRQECADHVSRVLAGRTIDVDSLDDYERETLEPYLPQPPAEDAAD